MVRPRAASNTNRSSAQREDLAVLSSEVLKLRLQALNLPITGFKGQLLARLKKTLSVNTGSERTRGRTTRGKIGKTPQRRRPRTAANRQSAGHTADRSAPSVETHEHAQEPEDSALSDNASSSSLEEMFGQDDPEDPEDLVSTAQQSLSPAQRTAIEAIVSASVSNALVAFRTPEGGHVSPPLGQGSCTPGMASPLGLTRPVDRHLEDKILRGEYVDLALLLPDNLYQSQTPELQLRLDDSALGSLGSPVTMIRKRKPVIDTFQKWLDAFTTFMIVLVTTYPRRALELIKYQQIISRAVTKFKGMAWLSYDQQFRRRAAYDLTLNWDKVDLELWTVTFSGLAKPHCNVCSSPYHIQDVCPSADPNRKPRRTQTVCFDFNKSSGCRRRNCIFPHVCRRCHSSSHAAPACQQPPSTSPSAFKPLSSSERSKK